MATLKWLPPPKPGQNKSTLYESTGPITNDEGQPKISRRNLYSFAVLNRQTVFGIFITEPVG